MEEDGVKRKKLVCVRKDNIEDRMRSVGHGDQRKLQETVYKISEV